MAVKAEEQITLTRVDDGGTGPQGPQGPQGEQGPTGNAGKSAYEAAVEEGYTGTEAQFNQDLADTSITKATAQNAQSMAEENAESISNVSDTSSDAIDATNTQLSGEIESVLDRLLQEVAERIAESLTNPDGLNRVTADEQGITISGITSGDSDTTLRITNDTLSFLSGVANIFSIYASGDIGSYIKADNASFATIQMKNASGEGGLGWVAQENGHLTLKEV